MLSEAVADFRIHAILLIIAPEHAEGRAFENVGTDQNTPVTFEVPGQARTEQPVRAVGARYEERLGFPVIEEFVIEQQAVAVFAPVGDDVLVEVEELALE